MNPEDVISVALFNADFFVCDKCGWDSPHDYVCIRVDSAMNYWIGYTYDDGEFTIDYLDDHGKIPDPKSHWKCETKKTASVDEALNFIYATHQ